MRKNYFKMLILGVFVLMFCTACNGNVTRSIRHDGFAVSNKIECDMFFYEGASSYNKIKFFTGSHIIDQNGKIYEISLSQAYQSGQNCKDSGKNIIVKAIMDNNIVRGADNGYYYLNGSGQTLPYTKISESDNNYAVYNLLLSDPQVVKVVTADSSAGLYYVLKSSGDVFGITISKADRNSPPAITGTTTVFNKVEFGAFIEDFNYAGNSSATYVKTSASLFRMKATNEKECSKFADVPCQYTMLESEEYVNYKDRVVAFNGSTLITDYSQVFTAGR
ncbi:MAG: hypothetical protein IJ463_00145 [Bacilli bacterium]|nr:hypothetical protein [Bacilli bacterium]